MRMQFDRNKSCLPKVICVKSRRGQQRERESLAHLGLCFLHQPWPAAWDAYRLVCVLNQPLSSISKEDVATHTPLTYQVNNVQKNRRKMNRSGQRQPADSRRQVTQFWRRQVPSTGSLLFYTTTRVFFPVFKYTRVKYNNMQGAWMTPRRGGSLRGICVGAVFHLKNSE